jgi:hypothetical protein
MTFWSLAWLSARSVGGGGAVVQPASAPAMIKTDMLRIANLLD